MLRGVYALLEAEADEGLGEGAAGFTDGLLVMLVGTVMLHGCGCR